MISKTSELVAYQQKEDSPEALATIPLLKLSDIKPEALWYDAAEKEVAGIQHLYREEFTNNILYMNYWFNLKVVPEDKLPYAALLTRLLGKMDAGSLGYEQLDKAININTGSFSSAINLFLPDYDDSQLMPEFRIQMKTTAEKLDTALSLLSTILNQTRLDNKDRLYDLLKRHQSQLESSVTQNGFGVAATRLESYYSRRGVFNEKTRGMDYYWFVTDLTKRFNDNPALVIDNLKQVYDALFSKTNMIAGTTCEAKDFNAYSPKFEAFAGTLKNNEVALQPWKLEYTPKNEGIMTASKVQYVIQGFDFRKLGLTWNGKWNVLNQVVSTDWLQTQVRVIGGAYGGFSTISKNGTIYLASYRDPNLKETLDNYKGTIDYLAKFEADSTDMTRYIIGTISNLDYPLTPSEKGEQAFRWYFEKVTPGEIQADRDAVLLTNAEDIRAMKEAVAKILDQQVYCVYGNDEKIKTNKTLFKELVKLQQ
jgi:Zn-dependent M16 (insulinase) family peptidase